jgi:undecaprenyl-diphosphatase
MESVRPLSTGLVAFAGKPPSPKETAVSTEACSSGTFGPNRDKHKLQNADIYITSLINSLAGTNGILDAVMLFLAETALYIVVASIAVRWFWPSAREVQRFRAISCGATVSFGLLLNQILLVFVERIRPYELGYTHLLIQRSANTSFPSDHATVASAVAFVLLLKRDGMGPWYLAAAAAIGLSRVFVGTHYVGDIAGGMATALVAALCVHIFYNSDSLLNRKLVAIL